MVSAACAVAGALDVEAVPKTKTGLPSAEPLFSSCIVPVGATPLLVVVTVAVTVTRVPASPDDGTPLSDVEVCAVEIITFSGVEVLPV